MRRSSLRFWRSTVLQSIKASLLRLRRRLVRVLVIAPALLVLGASCSSNPPQSPDNVCRIFAEKKGWKKAALRTQKRWGIPAHVSMAFVHRESSYVANAKPPRKRLLGIVPWTRLSSAYGYAQATDEAWEDYSKETSRWFIDRDNFADAMDFIGWYNHKSHKKLGIKKSDAYHLYIAYYAGHGGYKRGRWKSSPTIKGYAQKVRTQAERYAGQLRRC